MKQAFGKISVSQSTIHLQMLLFLLLSNFESGFLIRNPAQMKNIFFQFILDIFVF